MHDWDLTPEQRWAAQQRAFDAISPWSDYSKTLTRDAAGKLVQVARAPDVLQPVDDATYNRMTYDEKKTYAARMSGRK
jgi:hypothetical protein